MPLGDFGYKGIRSEFMSAFGAMERGSFAKKIAALLGSDQEIETYRWLGNPLMMRERIGGRQEMPIRDDVFRVTNKSYEGTLALSVDDIRREKYGVINQYIRRFAEVQSSHWDFLITELLLANGLCFDGLSFFNANHLYANSQNVTAQANELTASHVPAANVTTATDPTPTEMASILLQTVAHLYKLKDDANQPINQDAKQFAVMVPTTFWAAAAQALSSIFMLQGVSNPVLSVPGLSFDLIHNPRLTWTTQLAVFRMDGSMKPLVMQEEVPLTDSFIGPGSEEEFKNKRWLYGIDCTRAAAYGLWNLAARVTLS